MKTIFALLIAAALVGCATVGNEFDINRVDQLRPGVTTMAEAVQILGKPTTESTLSNKTTLLQWQYSEAKLYGERTASHAAVLFDAAGKMVRVTHRSVINTR